MEQQPNINIIGDGGVWTHFIERPFEFSVTWYVFGRVWKINIIVLKHKKNV